ncbi:AfsR/SARP family transcriptional regulator [Catenulispora pinisilvae]|uniref:AfsR/SARP family transcriptional regulator n=1 Tax=Catenulispora pinisilvae TaxID=2705253 RepID=UPI001891E3EC|nr:AfsR/SARP family transcriptional regulator [Catenulispora pinisilvae]
MKPKIVLANLLTRPGHVVSTQQLMDELWDGRPPRTATTALQVYVCKLRKLLSEGGADREDSQIMTQQPGYVLSMAGHESDLKQFEQLRDRADRLQVHGDLHGAAVELRKAVKLWHGPALADVRYTPRLRSAAERLDELRVVTIERLLELELVLGRHRGLTGELSQLAGEYPTRERVHELLMIALYNARRPNEALEAYQTIRTAMNDEFGLEPSHRLRSLQLAILSQDSDRLSVSMESPYPSRIAS